jgi:hypothetical protein
VGARKPENEKVPFDVVGTVAEPTPSPLIRRLRLLGKNEPETCMGSPGP